MAQDIPPPSKYEVAAALETLKRLSPEGKGSFALTLLQESFVDWSTETLVSLIVSSTAALAERAKAKVKG